MYKSRLNPQSPNTLAKASPILDARAISGAALRAFFRIAQGWGLSTQQQILLLGNPSRATYFNWKRGKQGTLSKDTLERISYLLGIYKALQILLPKREAADAWIKRPNTAALFGGKPALDRMLSGNVADLYVVRQYLDAERGG